VTLSLNTSFIGQASADTILTAKARRTGGGQTVFFARCDLLDGEGHLIATGEGSFKYLRSEEAKAPR
jgi:acyl-coenzyme A thioesterase PaaI-like protein